MSIAFITTLLLAPLAQSISSDPIISPPPPVSARLGVGDDVREQLYRVYTDVAAARARGEISADAARDLNVRVERIRRQMVRMGNIVGHRQRVRLRQRIDAISSALAVSRSSGGVSGSS